MIDRQMRKIDIEAERAYENEKVLGSGTRVAQSKYYWATQLKTDQFDSLVFGSITDKIVLEIGCSSGASASKYSAFCAHLTGIDISDEGISSAKGLNIKNATFEVGDAHKLPYADEQFDAVIVNGLLHHLNLELVLPEISRVLNKQGSCFTREPLGLNPIFKLYRFFTPSARTADEKPFDREDLDRLEKYFLPYDLEYFGGLSIFSAFFKSTRMRTVLTKFDELVSRTPLKYWLWQFYGRYQKR